MPVATDDQTEQIGRTGAHDAVVPVSRADRAASRVAADFAHPTGREEEWRFTPMDRLRGLDKDEPFIGGALPSVHEGPSQFHVETIDAADERVGASGLLPEDRPSARAWEAADQVLAITVPREADIEAPLVVRRTGTSETPSAHHVLVHADAFSRATVILTNDGTATLAENVEVVVSDGASLTLVSIQEWEQRTVHLSRQHVRLGRDATCKHIVVSLGGGIVRVDATATYDGPGGHYEGLGVYFADDGQHLEHRLFVDHEAPRCSSHVVYKGALQGQSARTVWVGDVLIRAAAEGTDTYELNRNLVLTEGARADSVPNLEIETGEIAGAGHASATGRFDDEQLFYLMARGIPQDEARRLVVRAFFAEIIDRIGVPSVTEHLMEAIDAELAVSLGAASKAANEEEQV